MANDFTTVKSGSWNFDFAFCLHGELNFLQYDLESIIPWNLPLYLEMANTDSVACVFKEVKTANANLLWPPEFTSVYGGVRNVHNCTLLLCLICPLCVMSCSVFFQSSRLTCLSTLFILNSGFCSLPVERIFWWLSLLCLI